MPFSMFLFFMYYKKSQTSRVDYLAERVFFSIIIPFYVPLFDRVQSTPKKA